jgi:hypothetical protein
MTTIAVRSGIVAYDSRITSSDGICIDRVEKAWLSIKHQAIIAVSGGIAKGVSCALYWNLNQACLGTIRISIPAKRQISVMKRNSCFS